MPARNAALHLVRPLERFLRVQAASGILLMLCAIVAMAWANSPFKESYHHLWSTPITVGFGSLQSQQSLHFWINDGLMVIFFFVVGLEIRREIYQGELSELRRASLPVAAALGGMIAPALIYVSMNPSGFSHRGWGIPMATDIAFAVGVLTLLGKRVPPALRVLLLALAIMDDIGAIIVIAVFYSSGISMLGFALAALGVLLAYLLRWLGVRQVFAYVASGLVVWWGMTVAGVHPTIAGVIMGLITPVRPWFGSAGFLDEASEALADFKRRAERSREDPHGLAHPLARLDVARREALAPVIRIEQALNPWVAFGIMPIFALANAGVTLDSVDLSRPGATGVALGVGLGLAIGKPIGIVLLSLLAVRLGLSTLPRGVDWRGLLVVGCLGGVGFTMALFIANLAFPGAEELDVAKLAVIAGSLVAGLVGAFIGGLLLRGAGAPREGAGSAGEAERLEAEDEPEPGAGGDTGEDPPGRAHGRRAAGHREAAQALRCAARGHEHEGRQRRA